MLIYDKNKNFMKYIEIIIAKRNFISICYSK